MGEIVVVKGGYILTPRATRSSRRAAWAIGDPDLTEDLFIGPTTRRERDGGMMHLNHSCEPNLGLQGEVVYVALCDIPTAGEELTADYAMTDDEPYEMTWPLWSPELSRHDHWLRLAQTGDPG